MFSCDMGNLLLSGRITENLFIVITGNYYTPSILEKFYETDVGGEKTDIDNDKMVIYNQNNGYDGEE